MNSLKKWSIQLWNYLIEVWTWFYRLFVKEYRLTVSYNNTWGDSDDKEYIVRKFYNRKEKYLRFKTSDGDIVEIRGADGLNYRIEAL